MLQVLLTPLNNAGKLEKSHTVWPQFLEGNPRTFPALSPTLSRRTPAMFYHVSVYGII